ncbi:MAG TPA: tRNA lysidine(34) synthetase TilS [Candidatus Acidoferrales bacterium]|nr:tRNA lysidine(34) synthetase TilS [Candidatus Acidoferrales bacterium]
MPPETRLLLALSGGPDSSALLLALLELGRPVVAAHFDHGLRPGSAGDAACVAALCRALGVRLIRGRRRRPLAGGSLQAAAREQRYAFLERARLAAGADLVAVAHTADDLVEGALLHLLRGTAVAGLRGMPARRARIVRPLLGVWRSEVEAHLRARGLEPLRDPSNLDRRFARVRVRLDLLPALEAARPGLARTLRAAAARAAELQDQLEARAERVLAGDSELAREPAPVRAEAIRQMYARAGGRAPALSRRLLRQVDGLLEPGPGGRGLDLPGGVRARVVRRRLDLVPAPGEPPAWRLRVRRCRGCAAPGAAHLRLGLRLELGRRSPGLRLRPLGGRGTRKLQDVLVDAGVPREDRDRLPLVFAEGRLAWVPGIAVDAALAALPGQPSQHVELAV